MLARVSSEDMNLPFDARGHGDTDKVHAEELREVVSTCPMGPEEWGWMTHAATVAGALYRAMYDHEAFR